MRDDMSNLGQYPNADAERQRVDDPPEVYRSQSDFAPPAHLEPADSPDLANAKRLIESANVTLATDGRTVKVIADTDDEAKAFYFALLTVRNYATE